MFSRSASVMAPLRRRWEDVKANADTLKADWDTKRAGAAGQAFGLHAQIEVEHRADLKP